MPANNITCLRKSENRANVDLQWPRTMPTLHGTLRFFASSFNLSGLFDSVGNGYGSPSTTMCCGSSCDTCQGRDKASPGWRVLGASCTVSISVGTFSSTYFGCGFFGGLGAPCGHKQQNIPRVDSQQGQETSLDKKQDWYRYQLSRRMQTITCWFLQGRSNTVVQVEGYGKGCTATLVKPCARASTKSPYRNAIKELMRLCYAFKVAQLAGRCRCFTHADRAFPEHVCDTCTC